MTGTGCFCASSVLSPLIRKAKAGQKPPRGRDGRSGGESVFADSSMLCSRPSPIVKISRARPCRRPNKVLIMRVSRNRLTRLSAGFRNRVLLRYRSLMQNRANQQNMDKIRVCFAISCGRTNRDSWKSLIRAGFVLFLFESLHCALVLRSICVVAGRRWPELVENAIPGLPPGTILTTLR